MEDWERDRLEVDIEKYYWTGSQSEQNLLDIVKRTRKALENLRQTVSNDTTRNT